MVDLGPSAYDYKEEEEQRERETERQVQQLMKETRIWRVANSAQWVAWGIVQAKIPELEEPKPASPLLDGEEEMRLTESPLAMGERGDYVANGKTQGQAPAEAKESGFHVRDKRPEGLKAEALLSGEGFTGREEAAAAVKEGEGEEFDYLAYAQDRAMFFWGDVVGLGIVAREELPESLVRRLKIVDR